MGSPHTAGWSSPHAPATRESPSSNEDLGQPKIKGTGLSTKFYLLKIFGFFFLDFPGGPVVRTQCFHCLGPRLDPWLGNEDPASYVVWPKKFFLIYIDVKKNYFSLKFFQQSNGVPFVTRKLMQSMYILKCVQCSARSPSPWLGKKTPRNNATCNRGIYY